jgi:methyl-accepting chemotaxis protein
VSLRLRIALLLAVIVSVGVAAVSLVAYHATDTRLMKEVDRSLAQATERFMQRPSVGLPFGPGNTGINIPERPLGIEQFVVQVLDRSGDVLAATAGVSLPLTAAKVDAEGRSVPTFASVTSLEGVDYRVRTVALQVGVGQLGRDLTESQNVLTDLRRRMAQVAVVVAVIAVLIGWFMVTGVTRRLRRLSHAVGEVASTGRLDVEALQPGSDEAGRLGRAFSDRLGALALARTTATSGAGRRPRTAHTAHESSYEPRRVASTHRHRLGDSLTDRERPRPRRE